MPNLVARPTTYNGIRMRSRLEARYAAALDRRGIRWRYEPRAFANVSGQYLPDFELIGEPFHADWPIFVEVKPTVALAYPAMERMQIILDSEPHALLLIVIPGDLTFYYTTDLPSPRWQIAQP